MFHRSCDQFKTMGAGDSVEDSELLWIGGCEAEYWLKIVIVMPAQLNWAGG